MPLIINAQKSEAWKVIGVYTSSIVLDAVGLRITIKFIRN